MATKTTTTAYKGNISLWVLLIGFILYLLFDHFSREYLFNLSIVHQTEVRNKYATRFYDQIAHVISELGDKYIVGIIIFIGYHTLDTGKSFIVMLAAVLCLAFSCVLKSIYHEARPFFIGDFRPNGCRFEYGNPSGHS